MTCGSQGGTAEGIKERERGGGNSQSVECINKNYPVFENRHIPVRGRGKREGERSTNQSNTDDINQCKAAVPSYPFPY